MIDLWELTFSRDFIRPLGNSLSNLVGLRKLHFGARFDQPFNGCLLNLINLRKLSLGIDFNQPIMIPHTIKKLNICCDSQYIIDYLPFSIEELVFGYHFNLELNDLPSSVKKITIQNTSYDKKLNNLPRGIECLEISDGYNMPIDFKYKNLNIVKI